MHQRTAYSDPPIGASEGYYGVPYTAAWVKKMAHSLGNMAASLGFQCNSELWALWYTDTGAGLTLDAYLKDRDAEFGWYDASNSVGLKAMSILFTDVTFQAIAMAPVRPDKDINGVNSRNFYNLVTAWYAYRLMKAKPTLSPRFSLGSTVKIYPLDGLHACKVHVLDLEHA